MDVTADTDGLRKQVETKLAGTFNVNIAVVFPTKKAMQAELDRKVGTGLKVFVDLNMPGKREMQAQLDTKTGSGLKLKIAGLDLPSKQSIQTALAARTPGLKLFIDELDLPGKQEIQAQLNGVSGKDGSRGIKLFVDELDLPGKQEMQAQLDSASGKDGSRGLKLWIDGLDLPLKGQMQAELDARVGPRGLKLDTYVNVDAKTFLPVLLATEKAQQAISAVEAGEILKRQTFAANQEKRQAVTTLQRTEKLENDKSIIRERTNSRLEILEEQAALRLGNAQEAAALRREVIEANLRARLEASDDAFQKRRQFAVEAAQRRLENQARKPILQTVLINGQRLSQSLAEFDRSVSRVLRGSLTAFTIWSAGVATATAVAAGAAIYNFARIEEASLRAGAVFTSDAYSAALLENGVAFEDFADRAVASSKAVRDAANEIAIETIFNPSEVAAGAQAFAQAGVNQAGTLDKLTSGYNNLGIATRFAQNEQISIAEAVELGVAGLNSAGLGVDELAGLYDKFTIAANSTNASAKEIAQAFSNAGAASFRSYGQSVEEAIVAISLFAKVNERGLAAGTQTDILIREVSRSAFVKAPEVWERYGVALEDANGKARPFADALVDLANLLTDVQQNQGNAAYVRLRKELDLTEKSARGLVRLAPQLNDIGAEGVNAIRQNLTNAAGATERQASVLTQSISVQFQNFIESFGVQLQKIGEFAAPGFKQLLDQFNGSGGLFEQLAGSTEKFGERLNGIFGNIAQFVQTDEFANGIRTIGEAVTVTLQGVADSFTAFSSAFNDTKPAKSVFEAVADSILGFARVSAAVLPVVARVLGQVFDFLIDNADAFETFAKLTLAVFVARKAWSLFVAPVLTATDALIQARLALIAWSTASTVGPVKAAFVTVATQLGLITTQANLATAAFGRLAVAETAAATAGIRNSAGAGAAALGTRRQGKGIFGSSQVGANLASQRRVGVEELATAAALAEADLLRRNRNAFAGRIDARDFVRQRGAVGGVEALDPRRSQPQGRGLFGFNQRQQTIADQARQGLDDIGRPARGAQIGKTTSTFAKLGAVLGKVLPVIGKVGPALLRIGATIAKFAGPIGLVILAVEGVIGIFRGFFEEINRGANGTGEVANTLAELKPIFDAIAGAAKLAFTIIGDILGVVGDTGKSVGRVFGGLFNQIVVNLGDVVRGIKLLFEGDLLGALAAFGDVIINTITLPFRLAIGLVIDLIGDVVSAFENVPGIGGKARELGDGLRNAAAATRDFQLNMSQAASTTDRAKSSVDQTAGSLRVAATSAVDLRVQLEANNRVAALAAQTFKKQADSAKVSTISLLDAVGGLGSGFNALAANGTTSLQQISSAAQSTTSQLLAMQAALEAGLGQSANAQNSIIQAQQSRALDLARQGVGPFTEAQVRAQIASQAEFERQQQLVASARRQQRDARLIEGALGTPSVPEIPATPSSGGSAAQRRFTDPDEAIQAAIDRLKPAARAAEIQSTIDKVTVRAAAAFGKLGDGTKQAEEGVALTRRETLLLADAMPALDAAIEKSRTEVERLDTALSDLQNTQLKGSQAFSDAAFENEQSIKRLQLARLDALAISGTSEESAAIKDIDAQINALQTAGERISLEESLQLDPLRRKLEQTFSPVNEDTFDSIVAKFNELSTAQAQQSADLLAREQQQERLNAVLQVSQSRFEKIDQAAQRSVEAFNQAQTAATGASTAISTVATSAGGAARNVNRYSTALENVPGGEQVVDRSLESIENRIEAQAEQFRAAGRAVVSFFTQGVNAARTTVLRPELSNIVTDSLAYLRSIQGPAQTVGDNVMGSFLTGLKAGFGSPDKVGSVAWYLNVFIPKWIIDNKGPVSYDATILVPAGQAVMEGFGRGLRSGFSQVQDFVTSVGPSLKEFVTADAFSGRTAKVMADIAIGKTPNIDEVFGDLRLAATAGSFSGVADPELSFLRPTLSLADTIQQAFGIVKALGGGLNTGGPGQISRPDGTMTASGNISAHTEGTAADIGTGGANPTPASLDLFAKAKALLGKVFKQVIHNGIGLNADGGSFGDSAHDDHVHLEWIKALGFDENSGKISAPPVIDIPGANPTVDAAINAAAKKYNIELAVLAGLYKQESGFRANVISADGGYGLAQLTSPGLLAQVGFNRLDPFKNAEVGARYLKTLLNQYGNVPDAVGAYNAGSKPFPSSTINTHIPKVMGYIEEFRRLFGSGRFGGFRERGGEVRAGMNYIVGERGPEILSTSRAGTIIPADRTGRMLSGKGASVTNQDNRTINVTTAATDPSVTADLVEARTRSRFNGVNFR